MRTQVSATKVAQPEASRDQRRVRASEIREPAQTVASDKLSDDLRMSREWEALARRKHWRPLL
jgi:hypothetical protein